ncbi:MAG: VanZ family protein [Edaphobacter sp.]
MDSLQFPMIGRRPSVAMSWVPAFFGLAVILIESTAMMSGANTSRWLLEICHALWGQTDDASFETSHLILRKLGHLGGYGVLGLMFRRGWYRSVPLFLAWSRSQLRLLAAGLAVWSVFGIACMDEWHQSFLPGRVSSVTDVMIDTLGAVLFNAILLVVVARRRARLVGQGWKCVVGGTDLLR